MEENLSEYITEYYEKEEPTDWDRYYNAEAERADEVWENL